MTGPKGRTPSGISAVYGNTEYNETVRRLKHGRIRPMHEPSFFDRLFGRY